VVPTNIERQSRLNTSFGIIVKNSDLNSHGIIVDHGSGVVNVVSEFKKHKVSFFQFFQTHYHADHLNGIYYNPHIFSDDVRWSRFYGPTLWGGVTCSQALHNVFQCHQFPVKPRTDLDIVEFIPGEDVKTGSTLFIDQKVHTLSLNHNGGCVAYKMNVTDGEKAHTIVIATDCELVDETDQKSLAVFSSGVDALIIDCKWKDKDYKPGHGHNCPKLIIEMLKKCAPYPTYVYLTHFASSYSTNEMQDIQQQIMRRLSIQVIVSHDYLMCEM
jgi:phosphoribosyl 1,2-cyclic phosphodiesterase